MAWTRPSAYLAGAALVLIVGSPIRQNWRPPAERRDGFPLSYYPMFSEKRGRDGIVHHLVGFDATGAERVVPHGFIGSGGLNQVRRQINRQVREGRAAALAEQVARRIAGASDPRVAGLVRLQVVTSRHRYAEFFAGDRTPRSRTVHAEVPVPGPAATTRPGRWSSC